MAEVKSRPGGNIDPLPDLPRPQLIPEISQKTNPFQSFLEDELASTTKPVPPTERPWPPRNEEELERYALDSLRMVGILEQQNEKWGLIRDPGGVVHRVRAGNFMGKNYGKILEVSEQRIQLLEKVACSRGEWQDRDAEIALSE